MKGLVVLLAATCCYSATQAPSDKACLREGFLLGSIQHKLRVLEEQAVDFWKEHGPDREYGGFHGSLDEQGNPGPDTRKSVIQQARHLWAFSEVYMRRGRSAEIRKLIDRQYRFLIDTFLDPSDGKFLWIADQGGQVLSTEKIDIRALDSNSFAILALSRYALAVSKDDPAAANEAKQHALDTFHAIDDCCYDRQYGGYDETNEPNWLPQGVEAAKGIATQLHSLESLSSLYEATWDKEVRDRLQKLIETYRDHIIRTNYTHEVFKKDWTPVGKPVVNFGRDLQQVYLLTNAMHVLGRKVRNEPLLKERLLNMGELSSELGYDTQHGGYFFEGHPLSGELQDKAKVWYAQADAMNGLFWTYKISGSPIHLKRLKGTLDWIQNFQLNQNVGEWFWQVDSNGNPTGDEGSAMSNQWKTSYHTLRALLYVQDWIED